MHREGPWEGYRRQAKHVSPVVSFPPSFARTFSSRERRLGTRQSTPTAKRGKKKGKRGKISLWSFELCIAVFEFFNSSVTSPF